MEKKEKKTEESVKKAAKKEVSPKEECHKPKRLNALGEWIHSPDWKPLIKVIDMKAVLK
ncbi:MAG: hypothetical protein LBR26_07765 [Prevotella sp.]|jgi:hypothetical protein|nr:hypothetical protein [Prevotella sp.]